MPKFTVKMKRVETYYAEVEVEAEDEEEAEDKAMALSWEFDSDAWGEVAEGREEVVSVEIQEEQP